MALPKRATAYTFFTEVVSQADTRLFQVNPTIAAGDWQISKDGGAFANLTTLPTVTPAAGRQVKIQLSATEMTADDVCVQGVDAAGAEWCDIFFDFALGTRNADDLAYPATSGRSMVIDASGLIDANVVKVGPTGSGTAQTARDLGLALPAAAPQAAGGLITSAAGSLDIDEMNVDVEAIQTSTAGLTFTSAGKVDASVRDWLGGTIPAPNVTGVPKVDLVDWLGSAPLALSAQLVQVLVVTNNDKTGYSLTIAPPTAAAIATAVWTDTTAGDFTTLTSPGKIIFAQLGGTFTTTSSSVFTAPALANAPTGGTAPTAAQNATAVWQDLLAGADFGTASSIGALLKADIDATISSRSTYAGADTAGTTTLLTRIASALTITGGGVTLADGVAHGGTPGTSTATLAVQQVQVVNPGGATAFVIHNTGPFDGALSIQADGNANAISVTAGGGSDTMQISNSGGGVAVNLSGGLQGLTITGGGTSEGLLITNNSGSRAAFHVKNMGGTGVVFESAGGGGDGFDVFGDAAGAALQLSGGTGHDLALTGSGDILGNLNGYIKGAVSPTFTGVGVEIATPVDSNLAQINGVPVAAVRLQQLMTAAVGALVDTSAFTPTTTEFQISFPASDQPNRYLKQAAYWATGANSGVTSRITGYSFVGGQIHLTVDLPLDTAPLNGDTFLVFGKIDS